MNRIDSYSKVMLTIIAVGVAWLCISREPVVTDATAQTTQPTTTSERILAQELQKRIQPKNVRDFIAARRFALFDESDNIRAVLEPVPGGAILVLVGNGGHAVFRADAEGATVQCQSGKRQAVLDVHAGEFGGPRAYLHDGDAMRVLLMRNGLLLYDSKEDIRACMGVWDAELGLLAKGTGYARVLDERGEIVWKTP